MVVNKGKRGRVPPKVTKKSDKIKPKATREGKNISVSNKGPNKRNKVIKTKEASNLLNRNETRSLSVNRKVKKVSEDASVKSPKQKSSSDSIKGKLSSSPNKGTKLNKTTPEKMKDTKKAKISKNMTSPTTTPKTKNVAKGNLTPQRQTRGGNKVGISKTRSETSEDKLKSPSKKQGSTKMGDSKAKSVKRQIGANKTSTKVSSQKEPSKKESVDKIPKEKTKLSKSPTKNLDKVTQNIKQENEANKYHQKGKVSQKNKNDTSLDGESVSSTSSKVLSKSGTKDKLTRKDVSFASKKQTINRKDVIKPRGKLDNRAATKNVSKKDKLTSTKDEVNIKPSKVKGKTKDTRKDGIESTKSVTRNSALAKSINSNKIEKRKPKISKAKLAQRQIRKMQNLGLLGAPPRRAASLNAAAMIHITEVVGNNSSISSPEKPQQANTTHAESNDKPNIQKKKSSPIKKAMEEKKSVKTAPSKESKSQLQGNVKQRKPEIQSESSDSENSDDSESDKISVKATRAQTNKTALETNKSANNSKSEKIKDRIIRTQTKKIAGNNKLRDVVKVSSPFISSSESEEDDEQEEEEKIIKRKKTKNSFTSTTSEDSLDTSRESLKAGTKRKTSKSKKRPQKIKKRKKTLRDEFNMDIRDMIVKKRIASLNASAIMSASYSTPVQSDKMKMNELDGIMTNSKLGESSANNFDASMADVPRHFPTIISKMEEARSSALATDLTSKKTSSKLSTKPQVKSSSSLSEPNRVGRGSLTPSSDKAKKKQKSKDKKKSKENRDNKQNDKSKPTFSTPVNARLGDFDEDNAEPQHIIVEINDERIKSQLIASAMKKAGSGSTKSSPTSILPLKKRQMDKRSGGDSKSNTKSKKRSNQKSSSREVIVTLSSSSSDEDEEGYGKVKISSGSHSESSSGESDSNSSKSENEDSEEEIEEICTEGARATANNQVIKYNHIRPSSAGVHGGHPALNTEMNKVDVIVDGRSHSVVAGMAYQVVQRVETISTTTAVVPRFRAPGHPSANDQGVAETPSANSEGSTSSRSSGKYTPLGALADLQPGSHNKSSRKTHHQNNPPVTGLVQPQVHSEPGSRESRQTTHESQQAHSSNTSSRFSSTIQHQGFYQPAGPLIRSVSPVGAQSSIGGSSPSHPPTATVQPTVFCTKTASSNTTRSATVTGITRGAVGSNTEPKGNTSPVKPTPQSASTFPSTVAPSGYSYSAAASSSAYGVSPYPPGYPAIYPNPPPAHVAQGTPFYPYPPSATPFYPLSHYPYATYPTPTSSEGVSYPYPPSSIAAHPAIPPPPPHAAYPGQYLVAPFQQISSETGVNTSLADASARATQVALPNSAAAYYYGGYSYPYSAAAAGRIIAPILALAPPPSGIVPAHQTSVYSYSVQQHPSLIHPSLSGVPGHYQSQYQASHPTQPPTQTPATLAASQVPTQDQTVNPEPPVAHQAAPQVPQNVHEPLKSAHDTNLDARLNSKKIDSSKESQIPFSSVEHDSLPSGTRSNLANISTKSVNPDVSIIESDENMHKRAEDLAGKISATVTITTNATSKLTGNSTREKNDFLSGQVNSSASLSSRSLKQQLNLKSNQSVPIQQYSKPQHIGGKPLLDTTKIVPNLSNLKPVPQANTNSKSLISNTSNQMSSNPMMATITPIYNPVSTPIEQSKGIAPVTTKSSLRDYRKPKAKGISSQVFKTSTNTSTNNRLSIPISGNKASSNVPDEISVTTVIGPPSNKSKANNHHQEPAIISCYPVTKSTSIGGNKRHASSESSDTNMGKKVKPSASQHGKSYSLPKGLTITEVNVSTPQGITGGSFINPLNVCATSFDQLHADDSGEDVIPVLHIPETSNSQSESSSGKARMQQKFPSINKQSKLPSGISNIRPLLPGSLSKGFLGNNLPSNGHPGMPSGLLRMTATSLQQKSFQSQLNIPKVQPNILGLHPRTSGSSNPKVAPKDAKSRTVQNKIGICIDNNSLEPYTSANVSQSNRLTLKPPRSNVPATITMSMAESAVSAVQPTTFKPVPARSKSYTNHSKQSSTSAISGPTSSKKGSQVSSPSSSRSSSRNSSLSPRDRSGSLSSKGNSSTPTSAGTSSPKAPNSGKKKTIGNIYDPKAPLVPWHVRNSCGPKTCNGWNWEGEGKIQKVYLNNEDPPISRICYNSMKHIEGDVVKPRDCIVLASGHRKRDLPFIAKVTSLWENPEDGEMCMSLLWYYRPEHVDSGRKSDDLQDEIFASKHRDFTSVACIEDKCYVMTFNEYCRYRKFQRMVDQGITPGYSIVPELMEGYDRADLLPRCMVAPDRVFLCRRVYDPRQKRIFKLGKQPLY